MLKKLLLLFIITTYSQILFAKQHPLTLADLNEIRQVKAAQMSPNGKHIAFTLSLPDNSFDNSDVSHFGELYLVNRKRQIAPLITGIASMGFVRWSADNRKLFFLSKQENDQTVSIYQMELKEKKVDKIYSFDTDIIGYDVNQNTNEILFWAEQKPSIQQSRQNDAGFDAKVFGHILRPKSLHVVNLNGDLPVARLINDSFHVIAAQWLSKTQEIFVKHAPSANTDDIVMSAKMSVVNLAGEISRTLDPKGKMGNFSVSPDEKHVAYIGNNDPRDPAEGRLWLLSVSSFDSKQLITDFAGHIEQIDWIRSDSVAFIAQLGLRTVLGSKSIEEPSPKYRTLLRNAGTLAALDTDSRGRNIALLSHTQKHPKELFWYTRNSTVRITNSNTWLKNRRLAKQIESEYIASDGQNIQALVIPPINNIYDKPPAIIFVHGGPESHVTKGWNDRYSTPISYASQKGFISIFPNYRGSTGRGIGFSKLGQKDYAGKEFEDLLDARNWIIDKYDVDPQKVGITGNSYGGYAAAWAATKYHEYFSASVSGMGIANQISKYGITDIPTEMIQLHATIYPWQDWSWYLGRSPIYHAKGATTPLLLLHGEEDKRVPPSQSIEMYRYFKMQSKAPTRLVLYPGEGHGFMKATAKLDYSMRLMRWMEHFLIEQHSQAPGHSLNIKIPEQSE